ncbi:glycosyltransferase family 2 protein, partial [Halorubrum ezzemoulense]
MIVRLFDKVILIWVLNMDQNKVSVIIPTYNRPDLLLDAVESVIKQTYKN